MNQKLIDAFKAEHLEEFTAIAASGVESAKTTAKTAGFDEGSALEVGRHKALFDKFGAKEGGPAFVAEQFAAGNDIGKATAAWNEVLEKRLEKQALAAKAHPETTTEPRDQGGAGGSSAGAAGAIAQFEAAVELKMKTKNLKREKAVASVVAEDGALAEAYRTAMIEKGRAVQRERIAKLSTR